MLEEYLKIFNDYLDIQDIKGALNYFDKIFIDSKYLKVKNLFLYLLGCITILPDKYLDYARTLFNYDLIMPVNNLDKTESKKFIKSILYHYFIKATNTYYEYMENTYSLECKRALLNLMHLAYGVKKEEDKIMGNLFREKDYYNLYVYVDDLVHSHPIYNNIYILYLLLQDYITKDYFDSNKKYTHLIDKVKHKQYDLVLEYYQNINYREADNAEISIIIDVLENIIKEKAKMPVPEVISEKKIVNIDKDMFLDFLISVEDVAEEEGFVILNPESKEINQEMRDLIYYRPNLASYEIGDYQKQVVINIRKNDLLTFDKIIFDLKTEAYNTGNSFKYIEYAINHFKHIIPSEIDAARLAQSYFRVGLNDEGLNALKLAIGIKKYIKNKSYSNSLLNYYMMQDYFTHKKEKNLTRNRQK